MKYKTRFSARGAVPEGHRLYVEPQIEVVAGNLQQMVCVSLEYDPDGSSPTMDSVEIELEGNNQETLGDDAWYPPLVE